MGSVSDFSLTVLGARGSLPVFGPDFAQFGGSTSCYLVQAGDQAVFLDAGSGLCSAPVDFAMPPAVLLSHLHLDHVVGLGMYARLSQRGKATSIYVPAEDEQAAEDSLNRLYEPPYWPVHLKDYAGDVDILPQTFPLRIGGLTIESMEGYHPGGCRIFRLSYGEKSLVYATDQELEEPGLARLSEFARGTDLLMLDGQYTKEECSCRKGFGHSSPETGLALMERCGAKQLLLIHHDPHSTDEDLLRREGSLGCGNARFARQGEVLFL